MTPPLGKVKGFRLLVEKVGAFRGCRFRVWRYYRAYHYHLARRSQNNAKLCGPQAVGQSAEQGCVTIRGSIEHDYSNLIRQQDEIYERFKNMCVLSLQGFS